MTNQPVSFDPVRFAVVRGAVAAQYGEDRADHLDAQMDRLRAANVVGLGTYVTKLQRSVRQASEFSATTREGVYAAGFAEAGAVVRIEPLGAKGPDLGLRVGPHSVNVEIKRLTNENARLDESLEDWYLDETDPAARSASRERVTAKVTDVIRRASTQLPLGNYNAVILSDWSFEVGRQNFTHAVEDLSEEVRTNGTYHQIGMVQYDSNFQASTNNYVWFNEAAEQPLPADARQFFETVAEARSRAWIRVTEEMILRDG